MTQLLISTRKGLFIAVEKKGILTAKGLNEQILLPFGNKSKLNVSRLPLGENF